MSVPVETDSYSESNVMTTICPIGQRSRDILAKQRQKSKQVSLYGRPTYLLTISQAALCTAQVSGRRYDIDSFDYVRQLTFKKKHFLHPRLIDPPVLWMIEADWESKCLVGRDFLGAVEHWFHVTTSANTLTHT